VYPRKGITGCMKSFSAGRQITQAETSWPSTGGGANVLQGERFPRQGQEALTHSKDARVRNHINVMQSQRRRDPGFVGASQTPGTALGLTLAPKRLTLICDQEQENPNAR
jgi:hypothetical protein